MRDQQALADKVRGRKQSLDYLADPIAKTAAQRPACIRIVHGDALEDAQYLESRIWEKLDVQECKILYVVELSVPTLDLAWWP